MNFEHAHSMYSICSVCVCVCVQLCVWCVWLDGYLLWWYSKGKIIYFLLLLPLLFGSRSTSIADERWIAVHIFNVNNDEQCTLYTVHRYHGNFHVMPRILDTEPNRTTLQELNVLLSLNTKYFSGFDQIQTWLRYSLNIKMCNSNDNECLLCFQWPMTAKQTK